MRKHMQSPVAFEWRNLLTTGISTSWYCLCHLPVGVQQTGGNADSNRVSKLSLSWAKFPFTTDHWSLLINERIQTSKLLGKDAVYLYFINAFCKRFTASTSSLSQRRHLAMCKQQQGELSLMGVMFIVPDNSKAENNVQIGVGLRQTVKPKKLQCF